MLQAVGDGVLIRIANPEEVTKAGIILPAGDPDWNVGIVESAGRIATEQTGLKPGDTVRVRGEQGIDFEYEGQKYLNVSYHEVMAILE